MLLLPALFVLLGERVNALAPRRWQRAAERAARPDEHGGWYRYAHWVMRRPVRVAVARRRCSIVLGLPALGVRFIGVDATVLPDEHERAAATSDVLRDAVRAGARLAAAHRDRRGRPARCRGGDPTPAGRRFDDAPEPRRAAGSGRST